MLCCYLYLFLKDIYILFKISIKFKSALSHEYYASSSHLMKTLSRVKCNSIEY